MDNLHHSSSINLVDNLHHSSTMSIQINHDHSYDKFCGNLNHSPSINLNHHSSTVSTQINHDHSSIFIDKGRGKKLVSIHK
jgi:hypothetical protein